MKQIPWLMIVALCGAGLSVPNAEATQRVVLTESEETPRVFVEATAEVTAKPDVATVELVVTTTESKLQQAFAKNAEASNNILTALRQRGVKPDDLKTQSYQITPIYDGKRKPVRYTVTTQLTAKVRALETLGPLLDDVVDEEVTAIRQVSFSVEEPYALERQARIKAAQLAKEKAEDLATHAGARRGRALKITEGVSWPGPIIMRERQLALKQVAETAAPPPELAPGLLKFTVTCRAEYALEP